MEYEFYELRPQQDITAYELALVLKFLLEQPAKVTFGVDEEALAKLPPYVRRHLHTVTKEFSLFTDL